MEISFQSAYRQLKPNEKMFVDGYVSELETAAVRQGVKLITMLGRPVALDNDPARLEMLPRALVRAAINERVQELHDALELSAHRTIKEVAAIAFSNLGDYMMIGQDGQPYFDLSKCTPEQLSAVQSVEIEETHTMRGGTRKFKFKLHDKLSGLDKLMRYQGLLEADNPHYRSTMKQINDPVTEATPMLPGNASPDVAADAYARLING